MNIRETPEVQVLILEVSKLLEQNESLRNLLEKTADQLVRSSLDLERINTYLESQGNLPVLGCPISIRLETVADTVQEIQSFFDYEEDYDRPQELT